MESTRRTNYLRKSRTLSTDGKAQPTISKIAVPCERPPQTGSRGISFQGQVARKDESSVFRQFCMESGRALKIRMKGPVLADSGPLQCSRIFKWIEFRKAGYKIHRAMPVPGQVQTSEKSGDYVPRRPLLSVLRMLVLLEQCLNHPDQMFSLDGFLKIAGTHRGGRRFIDCVAETGCQDYREVGLNFPQGLHQFDTAHLRHSLVRDNQGKPVRVAFEEFQRFFASR